MIFKVRFAPMKLERRERRRHMSVVRYSFQPLTPPSMSQGMETMGSESAWMTHCHGFEEVYPGHVSSAAQALPSFNSHVDSTKASLL